jgi:glutamine synthetase
LEKLTESLIEAGLDVYQIDHEDANGQFEINYTYADCLKSADDYIMFKMAASEIANSMGMICSFMPKPFSNRPGNGMHMHMSIGDGNKSLFHDDSDKTGHGLSKLAYHFMAGILAHAPALTALAAPTVNSYKRFWDIGQFAPSKANWGLDTRGVAIRVSANGRMEYRLPDGMVNPFLSHLYLLASIEDGLNRQLDAGEPEVQTGDIAGIELPRTLGEAIEAFKADDYLMGVMPKALTDIYVQLKEDEWARYCGEITQWEFDQYWEAIP